MQSSCVSSGTSLTNSCRLYLCSCLQEARLLFPAAGRMETAAAAPLTGTDFQLLTSSKQCFRRIIAIKFPQVRLVQDCSFQLITNIRSRCSHACWRNPLAPVTFEIGFVRVRSCTSCTSSLPLIRSVTETTAALSLQPDSLSGLQKVQRC